MEEGEFFKASRIILIEGMNELLNSWDGTAATAPDIVNKMKASIETLQMMQEKLDIDIPYSKEEIKMLTEITEKEKLVLFSLRAAKKKIADEMRGINKKESVILSYLYPKNQPVFVNHSL